MNITRILGWGGKREGAGRKKKPAKPQNQDRSRAIKLAEVFNARRWNQGQRNRYVKFLRDHGVATPERGLTKEDRINMYHCDGYLKRYTSLNASERERVVLKGPYAVPDQRPKTYKDYL